MFYILTLLAAGLLLITCSRTANPGTSKFSSFWLESSCVRPQTIDVLLINTPLVGEQSIAMSVSVCLSVCLSVCPRTYLGNYTSKLHNFSLHVASGCSSILLWRRTICYMYFSDVRFCRWRHIFHSVGDTSKS